MWNYEIGIADLRAVPHRASNSVGQAGGVRADGRTTASSGWHLRERRGAVLSGCVQLGDGADAGPRAALNRARPLLRAVVRSRMAHFVAGGALLFALVPRPEDTRRIDIFSADSWWLREGGRGRAGTRTRGFSGDEPRSGGSRRARHRGRDALPRGAPSRARSGRRHRAAAPHHQDAALRRGRGRSRRARLTDDGSALLTSRRIATGTACTREVHFLHVFSARVEAMNELRAEVLAADARSPTTPPAGRRSRSRPIRDVTSTQEGVAGVDPRRRSWRSAAFAQPVGIMGAGGRSRSSAGTSSRCSRGTEGRPASVRGRARATCRSTGRSTSGTRRWRRSSIARAVAIQRDLPRRRAGHRTGSPPVGSDGSADPSAED